MEKERDYFQDIVEIRAMMERSTKFVSISGWSGILAGIYALAGVFIAYSFFDFNPQGLGATASDNLSPEQLQVVALAIGILVLAISTAIFLSQKKARRKGEKIWNPTSKRVVVHLAVPLVSGGILIVILLSHGYVGLMAPLSLLFYGIALFNSSKFTYEWVKVLGLVQITLGLISTFLVEYSLWIWAIGFGLVHIFYGIYMHFKYER